MGPFFITQTRKAFWVFFCALSIMLSGCSSSSKDSKSPIIDNPSSASVSEKTTINLDLAHDPDGSIVKMNIVQVSGAEATQEDSTIFLAPSIDENEVLVFEISATDNSGNTTTKRISILVEANPSLDSASFSDDQLALCYEDNVDVNSTSDSVWEDLYDIETLDCEGYLVNDLSGLEDVVNLRNFYVGDENSFSQLADLSPLINLTQLKSLYLYNNDVSDLSVLTYLESLNTLHLIGLSVDSYDPIARINNLAFLHIIDMPLDNLEFLSGNTKIKSLFLDNNELSDISVIASLSELEGLRIHRNQVTSLDGLSGLSKLETLKITETPVSDISALSTVSELFLLKLSRTDTSDISALSGLTKLTQLSLGRSPIVDITPLQSVESLRNMVYIELDVTDFSSITELNQLDTLEFAEDEITDFTILEQLDFLSELSLKFGPDFDCTDLSNIESSLQSTTIISDLDC